MRKWINSSLGFLLSMTAMAGTNTLPVETGQVIQKSHVNKFQTALAGSLVPRNSSGVATSLAGGLGTSTYVFDTSYLDELYIGTPANLLRLYDNGGDLEITAGGTTAAARITSDGIDGTTLEDASVSDTKFTNATFQKLLPIGSILASMLTEAQFQAQSGTNWILADGGSAAGSTYQTVTGNSTVPDLRGVFLRGKNNSRSDGNEDPGGERTLGNLQGFALEDHTHYMMNLDVASPGTAPTATSFLANQYLPTADNAYSMRGTATSATTMTTGGAVNPFDTVTVSTDETRPTNVAVNYFIKIN